MKVRWIICVLIALAIHIVWLNQSSLTKKLKPKVAVPSVIVAEAEPVLPPPARPTPQTKPQPPENPVKTQPQRFRPNLENRETEKTPEQEENKPQETKLHRKELAKTAPTQKADFKEEIAAYRRQLLAEFKEQWQKVPDLNTTIRDLALLPKIDRHFGVKILAYSFVDSKPGPPFVVFNMDHNTSRKVDSFDFSSFSNRIKDRMLYTQYRKKLQRARQEYRIDSLMKVIGLVPIETDHYFAAKQLRAIRLAEARLDQVSATNGHYEPDGSGGFNLIIDTVLTTSGRTIPVQDEELRFSVVAKK